MAERNYNPLAPSSNSPFTPSNVMEILDKQKQAFWEMDPYKDSSYESSTAPEDPLDISEAANLDESFYEGTPIPEPEFESGIGQIGLRALQLLAVPFSLPWSIPIGIHDAIKDRDFGKIGESIKEAKGLADLLFYEEDAPFYDPDRNMFGTLGMGLVVDIITDPLTWVSFGGSAGMKVMSKLGKVDDLPQISKIVKAGGYVKKGDAYVLGDNLRASNNIAKHAVNPTEEGIQYTLSSKGVRLVGELQKKHKFPMHKAKEAVAAMIDQGDTSLLFGGGARLRIANPLTFGFTDLKFGTWDIGRNEDLVKGILETGTEANAYRRVRTVTNQALKGLWTPVRNLAKAARAKGVDIETGRDVEQYLELSGISPKWMKPLIEKNIITKDMRIPMRHFSIIRGETGFKDSDTLIKDAMGMGAVLAGSGKAVTNEVERALKHHADVIASTMPGVSALDVKEGLNQELLSLMQLDLTQAGENRLVIQGLNKYDAQINEEIVAIQNKIESLIEDQERIGEISSNLIGSLTDESTQVRLNNLTEAKDNNTITKLVLENDIRQNEKALTEVSAFAQLDEAAQLEINDAQSRLDELMSRRLQIVDVANDLESAGVDVNDLTSVEAIRELVKADQSNVGNFLGSIPNTPIEISDGAGGVKTLPANEATASIIGNTALDVRARLDFLKSLQDPKNLRIGEILGEKGFPKVLSDKAIARVKHAFSEAQFTKGNAIKRSSEEALLELLTPYTVTELNEFADSGQLREKAVDFLIGVPQEADSPNVDRGLVGFVFNSGLFDIEADDIVSARVEKLKDAAINQAPLFNEMVTEILKDLRKIHKGYSFTGALTDKQDILSGLRRSYPDVDIRSLFNDDLREIIESRILQGEIGGEDLQNVLDGLKRLDYAAHYGTQTEGFELFSTDTLKVLQQTNSRYASYWGKKQLMERLGDTWGKTRDQIQAKFGEDARSSIENLTRAAKTKPVKENYAEKLNLLGGGAFAGLGGLSEGFGTTGEVVAGLSGVVTDPEDGEGELEFSFSSAGLTGLALAALYFTGSPLAKKLIERNNVNRALQKHGILGTKGIGGGDQIVSTHRVSQKHQRAISIEPTGETTFIPKGTTTPIVINNNNIEEVRYLQAPTELQVTQQKYDPPKPKGNSVRLWAKPFVGVEISGALPPRNQITGEAGRLSPGQEVFNMELPSPRQEADSLNERLLQPGAVQERVNEFKTEGDAFTKGISGGSRYLEPSSSITWNTAKGHGFEDGLPPFDNKNTIEGWKYIDVQPQHAEKRLSSPYRDNPEAYQRELQSLANKNKGSGLYSFKDYQTISGKDVKQIVDPKTGEDVSLPQGLAIEEGGVQLVLNKPLEEGGSTVVIGKLSEHSNVNFNPQPTEVNIATHPFNLVDPAENGIEARYYRDVLGWGGLIDEMEKGTSSIDNISFSKVMDDFDNTLNEIVDPSSKLKGSPTEEPPGLAMHHRITDPTEGAHYNQIIGERLAEDLVAEGDISIKAGEILTKDNLRRYFEAVPEGEEVDIVTTQLVELGSRAGEADLRWFKDRDPDISEAQGVAKREGDDWFHRSYSLDDNPIVDFFAQNAFDPASEVVTNRLYDHAYRVATNNGRKNFKSQAAVDAAVEKEYGKIHGQAFLEENADWIGTKEYDVYFHEQGLNQEYKEFINKLNDIPSESSQLAEQLSTHVSASRAQVDHSQFSKVFKDLQKNPLFSVIWNRVVPLPIQHNMRVTGNKVTKLDTERMTWALTLANYIRKRPEDIYRSHFGSKGIQEIIEKRLVNQGVLDNPITDAEKYKGLEKLWARHLDWHPEWVERIRISGLNSKNNGLRLTFTNNPLNQDAGSVSRIGRHQQLRPTAIDDEIVKRPGGFEDQVGNQKVEQTLEEFLATDIDEFDPGEVAEQVAKEGMPHEDFSAQELKKIYYQKFTDPQTMNKGDWFKALDSEELSPIISHDGTNTFIADYLDLDTGSVPITSEAMIANHIRKTMPTPKESRDLLESLNKEVATARTLTSELIRKAKLLKKNGDPIEDVFIESLESLKGSSDITGRGLEEFHLSTLSIHKDITEIQNDALPRTSVFVDEFFDALYKLNDSSVEINTIANRATLLGEPVARIVSDDFLSKEAKLVLVQKFDKSWGKGSLNNTDGIGMNRSAEKRNEKLMRDITQKSSDDKINYQDLASTIYEVDADEFYNKSQAQKAIENPLYALGRMAKGNAISGKRKVESLIEKVTKDLTHFSKLFSSQDNIRSEKIMIGITDLVQNGFKGNDTVFSDNNILQYIVGDEVNVSSQIVDMVARRRDRLGAENISEVLDEAQARHQSFLSGDLSADVSRESGYDFESLNFDKADWPEVSDSELITNPEWRAAKEISLLLRSYRNSQADQVALAILRPQIVNDFSLKKIENTYNILENASYSELGAKYLNIKNHLEPGHYPYTWNVVDTLAHITHPEVKGTYDIPELAEFVKGGLVREGYKPDVLGEDAEQIAERLLLDPPDISHEELVQLQVMRDVFKVYNIADSVEEPLRITDEDVWERIMKGIAQVGMEPFISARKRMGKDSYLIEYEQPKAGQPNVMEKLKRPVEPHDLFNINFVTSWESGADAGGAYGLSRLPAESPSPIEDAFLPQPSDLNVADTITRIREGSGMIGESGVGRGRALDTEVIASMGAPEEVAPERAREWWKDFLRQRGYRQQLTTGSEVVRNPETQFRTSNVEDDLDYSQIELDPSLTIDKFKELDQMPEAERHFAMKKMRVEYNTAESDAVIIFTTREDTGNYAHRLAQDLGKPHLVITPEDYGITPHTKLEWNPDTQSMETIRTDLGTELRYKGDETLFEDFDSMDQVDELAEKIRDWTYKHTQGDGNVYITGLSETQYPGIMNRTRVITHKAFMPAEVKVPYLTTHANTSPSSGFEVGGRARKTDLEHYNSKSGFNNELNEVPEGERAADHIWGTDKFAPSRLRLQGDQYLGKAFGTYSNPSIEQVFELKTKGWGEIFSKWEPTKNVNDPTTLDTLTTPQLIARLERLLWEGKYKNRNIGTIPGQDIADATYRGQPTGQISIMSEISESTSFLAEEAGLIDSIKKAGMREPDLNLDYVLQQVEQVLSSGELPGLAKKREGLLGIESSLSQMRAELDSLFGKEGWRARGQLSLEPSGPDTELTKANQPLAGFSPDQVESVYEESVRYLDQRQKQLERNFNSVAWEQKTLYKELKDLYGRWAKETKQYSSSETDLGQLYKQTRGRVLTDKYAVTDTTKPMAGVTNARVLSEIFNSDSMFGEGMSAGDLERYFRPQDPITDFVHAPQAETRYELRLNPNSKRIETEVQFDSEGTIIEPTTDLRKHSVKPVSELINGHLSVRGIHGQIGIDNALKSFEQQLGNVPLEQKGLLFAQDAAFLLEWIKAPDRSPDWAKIRSRLKGIFDPEAHGWIDRLSAPRTDSLDRISGNQDLRNLESRVFSTLKAIGGEKVGRLIMDDLTDVLDARGYNVPYDFYENIYVPFKEVVPFQSTDIRKDRRKRVIEEAEALAISQSKKEKREGLTYIAGTEIHNHAQATPRTKHAIKLFSDYIMNDPYINNNRGKASNFYQEAFNFLRDAAVATDTDLTLKGDSKLLQDVIVTQTRQDYINEFIKDYDPNFDPTQQQRYETSGLMTSREKSRKELTGGGVIADLFNKKAKTSLGQLSQDEILQVAGGTPEGIDMYIHSGVRAGLRLLDNNELYKLGNRIVEDMPPDVQKAYLGTPSKDQALKARVMREWLESDILTSSRTGKRRPLKDQAAHQLMTNEKVKSLGVKVSIPNELQWGNVSEVSLGDGMSNTVRQHLNIFKGQSEITDWDTVTELVSNKESFMKILGETDIYKQPARKERLGYLFSESEEARKSFDLREGLGQPMRLQTIKAIEEELKAAPTEKALNVVYDKYVKALQDYIPSQVIINKMFDDEALNSFKPGIQYQSEKNLSEVLTMKNPRQREMALNKVVDQGGDELKQLTGRVIFQPSELGPNWVVKPWGESDSHLEASRYLQRTFEDQAEVTRQKTVEEALLTSTFDREALPEHYTLLRAMRLQFPETSIKVFADEAVASDKWHSIFQKDMATQYVPSPGAKGFTFLRETINESNERVWDYSYKEAMLEGLRKRIQTEPNKKELWEDWIRFIEAITDKPPAFMDQGI